MSEPAIRGDRNFWLPERNELGPPMPGSEDKLPELSTAMYQVSTYPGNTSAEQVVQVSKTCFDLLYSGKNLLVPTTLG